jgi:hypothetical protein
MVALNAIMASELARGWPTDSTAPSPAQSRPGFLCLRVIDYVAKPHGETPWRHTKDQVRVGSFEGVDRNIFELGGLFERDFAVPL